jgi:hypothetical protein
MRTARTTTPLRTAAMTLPLVQNLFRAMDGGPPHPPGGGGATGDIGDVGSVPLMSGVVMSAVPPICPSRGMLADCVDQVTLNTFCTDAARADGFRQRMTRGPVDGAARVDAAYARQPATR